MAILYDERDDTIGTVRIAALDSSTPVLLMPPSASFYYDYYYMYFMDLNIVFAILFFKFIRVNSVTRHHSHLFDLALKRL